MEIRNFDAYSPLHKSGHTSKEISSNGKLMTGGIRLTIWDMKVYRKFLYLTFCRKVLSFFFC